jgi:hypothetical protein
LALTVPGTVVKAAVFPVDDVEGPVTAINAANTNGESNEIVLKAGTYTLRASNNNIDGPNGLPSITGVITILYAAFDKTFCFDPLETVCCSPRMGTSWNV